MLSVFVIVYLESSNSSFHIAIITKEDFRLNSEGASHAHTRSAWSCEDLILVPDVSVPMDTDAGEHNEKLETVLRLESEVSLPQHDIIELLTVLCTDY
jgi:hypothetical protein